jgi:AcrR family transcriptional regulator
VAVARRNRVGIETRQRIVDATRALLATEGLEGATVKAICDTAGVRPGSLYNLFDTKEGLVLEVVGEAIRAVDPNPGGGLEDAETVGELTAAFVRFIADDRAVARIYLQLAVGGGLTDQAMGDRVLRHHGRRLERFGGAIHREHPALTTDEVQARAETLLAALNGLALRASLDPSFDLERHARLLEADATRV